MIGTQPNILVVNPKLPVHHGRRADRAGEGAIRQAQLRAIRASAPPRTSSAELFKSEANVEIVRWTTRAPRRAAGPDRRPAELMFATSASVMPHQVGPAPSRSR